MTDPVPNPASAAPPPAMIPVKVVLGGCVGVVLLLGVIWFVAMTGRKQATARLWNQLATMESPPNFGQRATRVRSFEAGRADDQLIAWQERVADLCEQRQKVQDRMEALKQSHPYWEMVLDKFEGWKSEYPNASGVLLPLMKTAYEKGADRLQSGYPKLYEALVKLIDKIGEGGKFVGAGDLRKEIPKFYADWCACLEDRDALLPKAAYLGEEAESLRQTFSKRYRLDLAPMPAIDVK